MTDFTVTVEPREEGTVLVLQGELDLAAAPILEQQLGEAESAAPASIAIEMAGVDFIDSSGLRVLLSAAGRARDGGWELSVENPGEQVLKVLNLTGSREALGVSAP